MVPIQAAASPVWLENILRQQPPRWLPNGYSNWNDVLNDAVAVCLKERSAPKDLSAWKYGGIFQVTFQHQVFGSFPILDRISSQGRLPQSGNTNTIKAVGLSFGPSERFTADLSDLDQSTLNIIHGQSGNLGDPHYMDQWSAWYNGTTFNLPFKPESVAKAKEHELRLVP